VEFPEGRRGSYLVPDSVTHLGNEAFSQCTGLTNVTIPNSVTHLGDQVFAGCTSLTGITIPNRVTRIGIRAFFFCTGLTNVTIGNSVATLGDYAFFYCTGLTNVTIPNGVNRIGDYGFESCFNLKGVYFQGDAPLVGSSAFDQAGAATIYYLPGTTGWAPAFAGRPTTAWSLPNPVILTSRPGLGVGTNGFGFIISWVTNIPVVVEAATDLADPHWSPVSTNTLTDGTARFTDPAPGVTQKFFRIQRDSEPPVAPVIIAGPESRTGLVGDTIRFTVTVTGTGPFQFQWQRNEADLPGKTEQTLTLNSIRVANRGAYRVIVTGPGGTTISNAAFLEVEL
jgi:hypothetical protein